MSNQYQAMDRPQWDEIYMMQAMIMSKRSSCPRAHVGAVIAKDLQVVSSGYNGPVAELKSCDDDGCLIDEGHCIRTVHAEMNAILQCAQSGKSTKDAHIFVTHFPCPQCMKTIAQAGISRVVYRDDYRVHPFALEIANLKGIKLEQLKLSEERVKELL